MNLQPLGWLIGPPFRPSWTHFACGRKRTTREGDAIAAARRRLPMVEVDGTLALIGECGKVMLPDTFEGHWILIAHYFMWNAGRPAPEQCDG